MVALWALLPIHSIVYFSKTVKSFSSQSLFLDGFPLLSSNVVHGEAQSKMHSISMTACDGTLHLHLFLSLLKVMIYVHKKDII